MRAEPQLATRIEGQECLDQDMNMTMSSKSTIMNGTNKEHDPRASINHHENDSDRLHAV